MIEDHERSTRCFTGKVIDLGGLYLGNKGAQVLVELVLRDNYMAEKLNLRDNLIKDTGLAGLVALLLRSNNPSLECIDLCSNLGIGPAGLQALLCLAQQLPQLITINLPDPVDLHQMINFTTWNRLQETLKANKDAKRGQKSNSRRRQERQEQRRQEELRRGKTRTLQMVRTLAQLSNKPMPDEATLRTRKKGLAQKQPAMVAVESWWPSMLLPRKDYTTGVLTREEYILLHKGIVSTLCERASSVSAAEAEALAVRDWTADCVSSRDTGASAGTSVEDSSSTSTPKTEPANTAGLPLSTFRDALVEIASMWTLTVAPMEARDFLEYLCPRIHQAEAGYLQESLWAGLSLSTLPPVDRLGDFCITAGQATEESSDSTDTNEAISSNRKRVLLLRRRRLRYREIEVRGRTSAQTKPQQRGWASRMHVQRSEQRSKMQRLETTQLHLRFKPEELKKMDHELKEIASLRTMSMLKIAEDQFTAGEREGRAELALLPCEPRKATVADVHSEVGKSDHTAQYQQAQKVLALMLSADVAPDNTTLYKPGKLLCQRRFTLLMHRLRWIDSSYLTNRLFSMYASDGKLVDGRELLISLFSLSSSDGILAIKYAFVLFAREGSYTEPEDVKNLDLLSRLSHADNVDQGNKSIAISRADFVRSLSAATGFTMQRRDATCHKHAKYLREVTALAARQQSGMLSGPLHRFAWLLTDRSYSGATDFAEGSVTFSDFLALLQKVPQAMESMLCMKVSEQWRRVWDQNAFKEGKSVQLARAPEDYRKTGRRRSMLLSKKMNRPRSMSQIQFGASRSRGAY
jgi:hypothetical protein